MNTILQKRIEEVAEKIVCSVQCAYFDLDKTCCCYEKKFCMKTAEEVLQNQWISVEEALPEFQQSVVVTNSEGDYWTSWRLNDNCEDTDDNGFVNNGIGEITHWMPIPSLEGDEK